MKDKPVMIHLKQIRVNVYNSKKDTSDFVLFFFVFFYKLFYVKTLAIPKEKYFIIDTSQ